MPGGALATLLLAAATAAAAAGELADGRFKKRKRLAKKYFPRHSQGTLGTFFGAILGPVRPSVPCCFGVGRCSCYSSVSNNSSSSSRWADGLLLNVEQAEKVGKKTKTFFSRNSEGTLGSFSVRFCGLFVLPCLAVLVPGGALATLLLAAATAAAAAGEQMGD